MNSFIKQIEALRERVEKERFIRTDVNVDPLSRSLHEFVDELAAMDNDALTLQAAELGITTEAMQRMKMDLTRPLLAHTL